MKNRIKEVMLKANLSQQDFAAKLGVSPASISSIFIGRTNPTITHASAVHKAFPEVRMEWLLFGEGEMTEGENLDAFPSTENEILDGGIDLGGELLLTPEVRGGQNLQQETSPTDSKTGFRTSASATTNVSSTVRSAQPVEVPDYTAQNRFPTYNDLQNAKKCDKPERKVKEIRVFYDDGTYEIFIPAMK
jgi:transcriptional regulator with XRE-family HTH domain